MLLLQNKTVCITGASSGIGAACAEEFAQLGCDLLLIARRKERIGALAAQLRDTYTTKIETIRLDVRNQIEVENTFWSLAEKWNGIDILVNNAGLARGFSKLHEGTTEDWDEMIDTNIKGLLYVTRAVLPSMVERNSGHIINIGSIAGHETYPKGNVYSATKFAVVGITRSLRMDLLGTAVRVSSAEPVISLRIEPKTKADQEKMGMALNRLAQEDPTFKVSTDQETGETIIAGMGELHLEIIVDRMKREFAVEANVGKPQVAYRETIMGTSEVEGKYIKQSGGRGNYGHVRIRMKPMDLTVLPEDVPKNTKRTKDFEFVNTIRGGVIPQEYIPAAEKGFKEGLDRGVLAGFKLVNVSVELYDGSYHEVDSNEMAFKIAASMAVQDGARRARPVILEPMMKVEVITPDKFMGDVTGNLSSKRGLIEGMEDRGMNKVVKAVVPLSEMFGFMTSLRSMTEGRAGFNMEFLRYDVVPQNVADEIIKNRK